ncbi:response regulator [Clostridium thermobutyricum]|uniref:Transcriptional regulatory protein n=1 Tax=Clostridium thermobutyricum DSM 4928 TaxID=1121339 RepID=A0A1V4SZW4_9CLOT|nr:response regulator [Clostridium thermobutyricum]OPX50157.1 transcriptional regulatory protein DcuR [Clostridium thermobutyricum DSM 4928]
MINVLIVEDDPMVALINKKYLEEIGEIKTFGPLITKNEIFDIIEKENIDLIIMDVFLPKENGLDILKALRENGKVTDVIMVTAANTVDELKKAFSLGIVDYLVKPFEFDRFKDSIIKYKKKREIFLKDKSLNQEDLDYILNQSNNLNGKENNLPKGLNKRTLEKIIEFLESNKNEIWTLRELAEKIKISNVTIKKYMDYLENENKLEVKMTCGNIGRPELKYKLK